MDPQVAGGGSAPFLQKTYDMVDSSSSDAIVSWGSKQDTFVVWDPLEFARILLPSYFKHNNFSSFIRQLNTYGFRKVDAEKWVFRNEDFVRGERHRLKNIHRKKPTHSHSNPIGGVDSERVSLEEEIERLSKERDTLQEELQQSRLSVVENGATFPEMESKLGGMKQRQERLINFLHQAVKNPAFVEQLLASVDAASAPKRRRSLSRGVMDGSSELADNSCSNNDGHSSTSKPLEFGHLFPQDFSNKLKLELCPAVSNGDLDLCEHQSLRECGDSPQRVEIDGNPDVIECRLFLPEEELTDTSMPMCQKRGSSLPWLPINEDEEPRDSSCQLNLTLASSTLHFNANIADRVSKSTDQIMEEEEECLGSNNMRKEDHFERESREQVSPGGKDIGTAKNNRATSATSNKPSAPASGRVNDLFWEQFLTERPGSSENEETSSCLKSSNQEDRMQGSETWMNRNLYGSHEPLEHP